MFPSLNLSIQQSLCIRVFAINLTLTHLSKAVIQINYSSRPHQHPTSYPSQAWFCVFLTIRAPFHPSTQQGLYLISHLGGRCLSLSWAWSRGINLAGSHVSWACSVWIIVKHITVEPNATPQPYRPAAPPLPIDSTSREKTSGLHNSCDWLTDWEKEHYKLVSE